MFRFVKVRGRDGAMKFVLEGTTKELLEDGGECPKPFAAARFNGSNLRDLIYDVETTEAQGFAVRPYLDPNIF